MYLQVLREFPDSSPESLPARLLLLPLNLLPLEALVYSFTASFISSPVTTTVYKCKLAYFNYFLQQCKLIHTFACKDKCLIFQKVRIHNHLIII